MRTSEAKLPDERLWPAELKDSPTHRKLPFVDRRRVLAVADRTANADDPYPAAQLMTAAFLWGTVKSGNGAYRRYKAFEDEGTPLKLDKAVKLVRREGALCAYRALSARGSLKILHLAPAFFTKFLYFGGYGAKSYLQPPVILDQRVARALEHFTELDWSGINWSTDQYFGSLLRGHVRWRTRTA